MIWLVIALCFAERLLKADLDGSEKIDATDLQTFAIDATLRLMSEKDVAAMPHEANDACDGAFGPASPVKLQLTLTNNSPKQMRIDPIGTPFQVYFTGLSRISHNFFPRNSDIKWCGKEVEFTEPEIRVDEDLIILEPKESRSAKIVLDADRNPIRFQKEGLNKLQLLLRILEVDSNGKAVDEGKVVRTNSIDLNIGAIGRRMLVDYGNVLYGNVAEDSFGVYFWEHECVDTVQMHGYFSIVNGERVDYKCSELSTRCGREPVIDQYCPQTCGTCDKAGESWSHPSLPRTIHFTPGASSENCQSKLTLNGVTKSMADFIQDFEDQKSQACASTLFHMKHQTAAFHEVFDLYFGDFTEEKFEELLGVITRICTVDDYTYNCDPGMLDSQSNSCSFRMSDWEKDRIVKLGAKEFETDFPSGRYVRQHDLVENGFQQHIIDCFNDPDIRCGYTSVLAYVKHQWVGNRNINLCPVSFWAQAAKPYGGLLQILHELSHFKDLAEAGHHYFSNRAEMGGNIYSTHAISLFMAGITDLQTMNAVNTWWTTTWDDFNIQISDPTSSPSEQMPFVECSDQRAEFKWDPMDNIAGEPASMEASESDCATRCEFTNGCIGTTFESDGTCHLSGQGAQLLEITGEAAECTNESDAEEYCMQYYKAYMRYCDRYTRYCSSWSFVKDCCRASCNNCKPTQANTGIIARECAAVPGPTMAPTFKDAICGTIQVRGSSEPHKQFWSLGDYSYHCRGPSGTPYIEGFNNPRECCLPQREHELICSGNDGWKGGYITLTQANGESREYCRDFTSGHQQKTNVLFP